MSDLNKDKFFLLIKNQNITFSTLNSNNKTSLNKEFFFDKSLKEENFDILKKFLDQKIIYLEKKFKSFIKDINLIIDFDKFIEIKLSTIHNFKLTSNHKEDQFNYLKNIKDEIMNYMSNYDLVHMSIDKFLINEEEFSQVPNDNTNKNIYLRIKFVLIKKNIFDELKKIFLKYEISIKNIFCYKHLNSLKRSDSEDIFTLAENQNNGHYMKEILIKKNTKIEGFFTKFFNFFN